MCQGLNKTQINDKIKFINDYIHSENAATAAKFDANANVSNKNIATLEAELYKDYNIQINRHLLWTKIKELFGESIANQYLDDLEDHIIYTHDETSLKPYCTSVSMYPFLLDGLKSLGGESGPPQHLESFCGSFVNLVFAISSQFAGAVAAVEFLPYFDHFARKDYGDDYINTHTKIIDNHLQHVIYAINQPAAARGFQSVFFNISVFDEYYFNSLFENFVFPDATPMNWETTKKLQEHFMSWFNKEREKAVLTFPVVTAAFINDGQEAKDKDFLNMITKELSEGNSFFMYLSDSVDSLASCCRLRNEFSDNTFSYSLGAGGVATGSINVMTLNMNRLVQRKKDLLEQIKLMQKYQIAYRKIVEDYLNSGMLPVYDAGYITLKKQFLTLGINGMVEAAEYLGYIPGNNDEYKNFVGSQLKIIFDQNKVARSETGYMFNTEFVPAENLGVKFAKWDKEDGLFSPRDCYNSYFYPVESDDVNIIDKFILHGKEINQFLDGGSALHLNLEQYTTQEGFKKLIDVAIKTGTNYFCTNVKVTVCEDCGFINKNTEKHCTKCGSKNVTYATRIIGYLKKIDSWSVARQKEHNQRYYHLNSNNNLK